MKKFMSLLLVGVMFLSIVSCDNTSKTTGEASEATDNQSTDTNKEELVAEEGATLVFSYWAGSPSDEAAWNDTLAKFKTAHPEIKLQAEAYPSENYVQMIDTMVAGKEWPDVLRYTYQKVGKFKEADEMLDLTPYLKEEDLADFIPAYLASVQYNGKLVGLPHHTDTLGIFYNKRMFEESKIRIPSSPTDGWTWDEMKDIARKLKEDHQLENVFGGIWENKNAYRYLPFAYMNGGSLLSEDGTKLAINTPEFIESIKLYEDMRKEGLASATGFTQKTASNMAFVAEQLAFVFAGSWQSSFMDENFKDKWGVTYWPQVNGKTTGVMGGNMLFAHKDTKYPKAATILMDFITSKDVMKSFSEMGSFIPVRTSLMEEGLKYESFQKELDLFSEIVGTLDPKMAFDNTSAAFQDLNVIMSEEMDKLIIAGATAEEVVAAMETRMQEALDDLN